MQPVTQSVEASVQTMLDRLTSRELRREMEECIPLRVPLVVSVGAVYNGNFGSVAWGSGARDFTTANDRIIDSLNRL